MRHLAIFAAGVGRAKPQSSSDTLPLRHVDILPLLMRLRHPRSCWPRAEGRCELTGAFHKQSDASDSTTHIDHMLETAEVVGGDHVPGILPPGVGCNATHGLCGRLTWLGDWWASRKRAARYPLLVTWRNEALPRNADAAATMYRNCCRSTT